MALRAAVESLSKLLINARPECDLPDLLWSFVNSFHRRRRVNRELDANETSQPRRQAEEDGSEIRSVEPERLISRGLTLIERCNAFELIRSSRRTLCGGDRLRLVPPLRVMKLAESPVLLPRGLGIAFSGGADCNDYMRIRKALDKALAKHLNVVLRHGGGSKGVERIASCCADNRRLPQAALKPDCSRYKNTAPFKPNDATPETLPICGIVFLALSSSRIGRTKCG